MKIEFYKKKTGRVLHDTDYCFFVMNNKVYCDTGESYESQEATICFDDFVKRRPDIDWRPV